VHDGCEIPAEAIKADTEASVNIFYNLFKKIWEEENIPEEWKEGILAKMLKKGDLRNCNNYWNNASISARQSPQEDPS
jgi:hypothetical protein